MSNPNAPFNRNHPDRDTVLRIAREEAQIVGVKLETVLGMSKSCQVLSARRRAMRRILRETGCSVSGLAEVWGCWPNSVVNAVGAEMLQEPPKGPGYREPPPVTIGPILESFAFIDRRRGMA